MAGNFDFAPDSHVAEEIAPEEKPATSFNGWEFTARPSVPYRPRFRLTMSGMRWYLNSAGNALDLATNPAINAGCLRAFFLQNRLWGTFNYDHEYLGPLTVRFAEPLNIPKAMTNSNGLIPDFEVMLVHHNPSF